ncbi:MAG: high-potential iron-sulfur protein [Proteobacteria bacterium]|nr:MAG: high-potential iron-sulfur protein [Pseudomonadota bacterium]
MSHLPTSRRKFLKASAIAVSSFSLLKILDNGSIPAAYAQAAGKALDENDPTAKALGYVHDAAKTDTAKFPKRKGPEGEKQFCDNCMFYTQGGLKAEGKEGEWGKCTIFPAGLVAAKGWCNSWTLKPGA